MNKDKLDKSLENEAREAGYDTVEEYLKENERLKELIKRISRLEIQTTQQTYLGKISPLEKSKTSERRNKDLDQGFISEMSRRFNINKPKIQDNESIDKGNTTQETTPKGIELVDIIKRASQIPEQMATGTYVRKERKLQEENKDTNENIMVGLKQEDSTTKKQEVTMGRYVHYNIKTNEDIIGRISQERHIGDTSSKDVKGEVVVNEDIMAKIREARKKEGLDNSKAESSLVQEEEVTQYTSKQDSDKDTKKDSDKNKTKVIRLRKKQLAKLKDKGKDKDEDKFTGSRKQKKKMKKNKKEKTKEGKQTTKVGEDKKEEIRPEVKVVKSTEEIKGKENIIYKKVKKFTGKIHDKITKIKEDMQEKLTFPRKKLAIAGAVGCCILAVTMPVLAKNLVERIEQRNTTQIAFEDTGLIIKTFEKTDSVEENKSIDDGLVKETEDNTTKEKSNNTNYAMKEEISETKTDSNKQIQQEDIKEGNKEQEKEENINEDIDETTEYLKSIEIGTKMNINEGRFFEKPDGTGKYGHFENHQENKKVISKIGIETEDGYISMTLGGISLYDLKESFPEAEFSYHFVDDEGNILGWLTKDSFEEIIEKDDVEIIDEEER